jgi:hypothetical protein
MTTPRRARRSLRELRRVSGLGPGRVRECLSVWLRVGFGDGVEDAGIAAAGAEDVGGLVAGEEVRFPLVAGKGVLDEKHHVAASLKGKFAALEPSPLV